MQITGCQCKLIGHAVQNSLIVPHSLACYELVREDLACNRLGDYMVVQENSIPALHHLSISFL